MRVRFLGDGDVDEDGVGKPCVVFGHTFPVGEWVEVPDALTKLAHNPMFEKAQPGRPKKSDD